MTANRIIALVIGVLLAGDIAATLAYHRTLKARVAQVKEAVNDVRPPVSDSVPCTCPPSVQ